MCVCVYVTEQEDTLLYEEIRAEIQAAVEVLDTLPVPSPDKIFDLVYEQPTPQLEEQRAALLESFKRR
jgi:TPP-dependent pyruvate/acetoin dehydrogenase alpha subunit